MLRNPLINTPLQRGLEFGHFLPISRSETTMVAVGLSPRTAAKHTIRRRGATIEGLIGQLVAGSSVATRRNSVLLAVRGLKPTAYRQLPLCGTGCCAT